MTKNEIIRELQKFPIRRIYHLDIVYHKMTFDGSFYYRYVYSAGRRFSTSPLSEVLLSLYKLRGAVRALYLVYYDSSGQLDFIDYKAKDFVDCETLSDFINSKL